MSNAYIQEHIQYRYLFSRVLAGLVALGIGHGTVVGQWPQWGGPDRNFTIKTAELAPEWPATGPKVLWQRTLGTGYSAAVVDDGKLFTMYRKSKQDVYEYTIALDAATGQTLWQKRNMAAVPRETADHGKEFSGPNATPLIVGDRLYTLGRNAALNCYNKSDGKILWHKKLKREFGAQIETCGYSCSPINYGNAIIVPVGRDESGKREGESLLAFEQDTGDIVWKSQTFKICHASPILIKVGGEDQYVLCTKEGVIGVNPSDGELLWELAIPEEQFQGAFTSPVWDGIDTLYCASREYGFGIKLSRSEGKTVPEQLWSSRSTPLGMGTPVLVGDMLVGARRGTTLDTPVIGVDLKTGERLWHKRVFPQAVTLGAGGKLIILDYQGNLGLATATREDMTVHSQCQVTEQWSFTVPTLVGATLYVRDEKQIMALDLGRS